MARPTNKEYRAIILGAFDTHMHRTLREVNDYLDSQRQFISNQSTRRMLNKMVSEGLLIELQRTEKNAIVYTKAFFNPMRKFATLEGELVGLKEFITLVSQLDSNVIDKKALTMVKGLMLNCLASTHPEPYTAKGRSPVAKEDVKRNLTVLLGALSTWHSFIKNFLDAKIWDDFNREMIGREFKGSLIMEHAAIVDGTWQSHEVNNDMSSAESV